MLTGVTVVLSIKAVGVLLVSALLVIPAVTALQVAKRFGGAMGLSVLFAVSAIVIGITLSFFGDVPAGATIVLTSVALFLFFFAWRKTR
jgi:zinc transport system permease protein